MGIGTGTVKLSEVKTEFGGTFARNNLRSYLKCGAALSVVPVTTVGSSSVNAPAGSKFVLIEIWGGGGGGGRGYYNGTAPIGGEPYGGGGGGAGSYTKKLVALPDLFTFNCTVGAGGAGGTSNDPESGSPAGNGGNSTVSWTDLSMTTWIYTSGGGLGGQNAVVNPSGGGMGGVGGTSDASGDAGSVNGKPGTDGGGSEGGTGGYSPYGGMGGTPRLGLNAGYPGVAPGGGGGANISGENGQSAYGGAGARGEIRFTFFSGGAFIAEHENNNSIPNTGTVRLGDFRSTSTYTVDRDFETDNYTGEFREYVSESLSYYRTGLCTSDATAIVFGGIGVVTPDQTPVGTKGTIDVIGRSINALGETAVVNSIFDWRLVSSAGDPGGEPASASLFLEGDRRESVWDFPWTTASVNLNNTIITLNRIDTVVPAGSYDSVKNVTSWFWNNQIFGFVNGDPTPFTFKARVTIV